MTTHVYDSRTSSRTLHILMGLFLTSLVLMFGASTGWSLTGALAYTVATITLAATAVSALISIIVVMLGEDRRLYGKSTYGM